MNIVYISKYVVLPEFGSPTRQYFLSKYLSKIDDNKVLLIGSKSTIGNVPEIDGLYRSVREDNLQIVTLQGPKMNLGFNFRRLWSWIVFEFNLFRLRNVVKSFRPDVVIVSSLSLLTFINGIFLKKWLGIPLVLEIRDIYPLTLIDVGGYSKNHPFVVFLGWIEKLGYRNANLIVSTLSNAKEHIKERIKNSFNFQWLPIGVDIDYFVEANNASNSFSKNSNDFLIGYAGTLGTANALDVVFKAAIVLQSTHPKIKFVLIGEGPLKTFYQDKYGSLPNLLFRSAVPKKDLQPILKNMDILINSWLDRPIYKFGISPNKWIDYMLAARPILVSFSGHDDIIKNANCGIIVPAENSDALIKAIIDLYNKPKEQLDIMGENGRKYLLNNLSYKSLAHSLNQYIIRLIKIKNT